MNGVERIVDGDRILAYVIRASMMPDRSTFVTPPDTPQQVGFIAYPAGGEIRRHLHLPLERKIVGTPEVLVVRKGHCEIDIYNDDCHLIATRELRTGDVMVMVGGGHGFRLIDDTVFLEVKQGPYAGREEKKEF